MDDPGGMQIPERGEHRHKERAGLLPCQGAAAAFEQVIAQGAGFKVLIHGVCRAVILYNIIRNDQRGEAAHTHQLAPQLQKALVAVVKGGVAPRNDLDGLSVSGAFRNGIGEKFADHHRRFLNHIPADVGGAISVVLLDQADEIPPAHDRLKREKRCRLDTVDVRPTVGALVRTVNPFHATHADF